MRPLLAGLLLVLACASPARADLQVALVHFGIGTGAVDSTVVVSGVGFTPKAIIFLWNGRTNATDAVGAQNIRPGIGFACGPTDRRSRSGFSQTGVGTTATGSTQRNDAPIVILAGAAGFDGWADLTALGGDGFTLTIRDQFTADYRIAALVLGGTDVTNCMTGEFMTGAATGNKDITTQGNGSGAAIDFTPDTVLFAGSGMTSTGIGISGHHVLTLGAAAGATPANTSCGIFSASTVTTPNTVRYCRTGDAVVNMNTAGTIVARGAVTAWLPSGFRVNLATASSSRIQYWMALKGPKFFVGDLLTRTDGADIVESGFGFQPSAGLVLSHGTSASSAGTPQDHAELSIGAAISPSSRLALSVLDEDKGGASNSETATAIEFDALYANISTADAIEGLMDYKTQNADGATFVMDDTDPGAAYAGFWFVGPTGGAPPSCSGRKALLGAGPC